MAEKQVTVEGVTHSLPEPFMVIASQLPYGSEGTYPLTEVQMDRFMFNVWSDYLSPIEEMKVIEILDYIESPKIKSIVSADDVLQLQKAVKKVHVSEAIREYIVSLVSRARKDSDVLGGPSTRATVSFFKGARAVAMMDGRDYVIPDDVKRLAYPVLSHRLRLKPEAEIEDVSSIMVIDGVLRDVAVPTI